MGAFLVFLRLVNIMYRVFSYASISKCVQSPLFLLTGIGSQIIGQLLSLRWEWATFSLSFIVIVSYLNMLFCKNDLHSSDEMAVLVDTVLFDIFATLLLSYSWLISAVASFILKAALINMLVIYGEYENS